MSSQLALLLSPKMTSNCFSVFKVQLLPQPHTKALFKWWYYNLLHREKRKSTWEELRKCLTIQSTNLPELARVFASRLFYERRWHSTWRASPGWAMTPVSFCVLGNVSRLLSSEPSIFYFTFAFSIIITSSSNHSNHFFHFSKFQNLYSSVIWISYTVKFLSYSLLYEYNSALCGVVFSL